MGFNRLAPGSLVSLRKIVSSVAAEPNAARLGGLQRSFGPDRDRFALVFGYGCKYVQR